MHKQFGFLENNRFLDCIKKKLFRCRIRNHTPTRLIIWICSAAALIRTAGVVALIVFHRVEQNASKCSGISFVIGMGPDWMWFINELPMPCYA